MAKTLSALDGRTAEGPVTVRDAGLHGMITLRGDFTNPTFAKGVTSVTGLDLPDLRKLRGQGDKALAWMSPDELLLLVPHADADATVAALSKALAETHHMAVNVSDARALISLEGEDLRDILGKLAPVDLHPEAFAPGDFRRTRLGQIAAALWFETETLAHVVCFRSVAEYMFNQLVQAARDGEVAFY
jgi:sarcosine oxidase subunit gamma